ncbi:MAG: sigma 54-interacting transcriptional regulator [Planctomycetota bacterium]
MTDGGGPRLHLTVERGARAGERFTPALPCAIGRAGDGAVALPDAHLSSAHGLIDIDDDGALRYRDRGSSNGSVHVRAAERTVLGRDTDAVELWDGDALELGDSDDPVVLRIEVPEAEAGEIVARRPIDAVDDYAGRVTAEPGRLSVLYRFSNALGRTTRLDRVLEVAARLVFELIPRATHVAVALAERGGRYPVVHAESRGGEAVEIPVSRTLVRRVIEERAGLLVTNAASEVPDARSVAQSGMASVLCVPLWTGDAIRGVLQVDNRDRPRLFTGEDLEVLTVAAGPVSFAAENARLVARLELAEQRLERENRYLKQREEEETYAGIISAGKGQGAMGQVLDAISKVKDTRVPVLITGETGTGKELVARALHYQSERKDHLFIPQNMSALPENLLESELFGHVRGAFTGADRDKKGLFELADGGTIFLDEMGEMPAVLQAKLLRVLQEGEIWPVGAPRPKSVDVRVVSATHRDLDEMVRGGSFRQDLYYRLNVYPIRLPPLRERREDVPVLAMHFLGRYAREFGRPTTGLSAEVRDRLMTYGWPGNVRELQNEIQRILIGRTEGDLVLLEDLSPHIRGDAGGPGALDAQIPQGSLKQMMEAVERVLLARALRDHDNNKTRTAESLGITREGLHKKLTRFGMN